MLFGMDKRNSAYIREEAAGDLEREKELRRENEDGITSLPRIYTSPVIGSRQFTALPGLQTGPANVPFDFGFSNAPSPPQKPTPRFASLPLQRRDGWRIDHVRPDIPGMLTEYSQTFGRRTCVFVCGPPSMRIEVTKTVARLQQQVMMDSRRDEIFLHAENYNI
jgi:hypothetical protein